MFVQTIVVSLLFGVTGQLSQTSHSQLEVCEDCRNEHTRNHSPTRGSVTAAVSSSGEPFTSHGRPMATSSPDEEYDDVLLIVEDREVPPNDIGTKNHAKLTLPAGLLIEKSVIPGAGLGVIAKIFISDGLWFGPYVGETAWPRGDSTQGHLAYAWGIDNDNGTYHYVNAQDPARSNWLRYVNCPRNQEERNLQGYQLEGELYYRTVKAIYPGEELLVYYGDEYADMLGIKMKNRKPPENSSILYDSEFTVTVETGDDIDAGTDSTVYITAEGEYGFISYNLRDEDGEFFEGGNTDNFELKIYTNIGEIHRIRVGHDDTGASGGWYLAKITMMGNITKRELVFHCDCWLDASHGTGPRYLDAEDLHMYVAKLGLLT